MANALNWCTIESDPGVFTELMTMMGVKDVQMEELLTLDEEMFNELKPIYGLIFLFKWRQERDERACEENYEMFFANQVINNACATQAILSILLNIDDKVEIGPHLRDFKAFTREFPSELKGLAISNSELIRTSHNSFSRPEPFIIEERKAKEDDDIFHFIAYLPYKGVLYELDGLKSGPISLGPCAADDSWLETVRPIIARRIERYARTEIRFNLMALVRNRRAVLDDELARATARKALVQTRLQHLAGGAPDAMQAEPPASDAPLPADADGLGAELIGIDDTIADLERRIAAEADKARQWRLENVRRKHNYIPFLVNMLKLLAEKGELLPLLQKAQAKKGGE